jgi:indolepyruvate ferredoxin oxidoreductase beta subunit
MFQSIFLTGLGGQGIITLANLISEHASDSGFKTTLFNAKGMAQRGGRVTSEIRMTDDAELDFGARISAGRADILIGMEIGETINSLSYLREGGNAILLNHAYVPTDMIINKRPYPSFQQLVEMYSENKARVIAVQEAKNPYNIYILGIFTAVVPAVAAVLGFYSRESMEQAIAARLKRGLEENLESFSAGYEHGQSLLANV